MQAKEIAKKAGVSVATVYRVMAKSPGISAPTVAKIEEVMRQLGISSPRAAYQRSPRRKASTGITTGQIAFVLLGNGPDASLDLIRGIESVLTQENVRLTFAQVESPDQLVALAQQRHFDGLILHGWHYPAPSADAIEKLKQMALVWVMTHTDDWGDCVQPDNAALGRLATEKLIAKGVSQLAAVVPEPGHIGFEQRAMAMSRMAVERNFACQILRWEPPRSGANTQPPRDVLPSLMERLTLPNAGKTLGLLVPEDKYLGAVYHCLTMRSQRPGHNVIVASCGTQPDKLVGLTPTPLSVHIDLEEIGKQTAQQLLWRLAHRDMPVRTILLVKPQPLANEASRTTAAK